MSRIKFEIDSDDVFGPYADPDDFTPIETLIKNALSVEVKNEIQKNFSNEKFTEISKNIALECIWQIEKKLYNLINEDIVMSDRWGKPTFIGSVEDYIKKQIDDKMLSQVDSYGKTLSGSCSTGTKTWIEWRVEKIINNRLGEIDNKLKSIADYHCKKAIDEKISKFKNEGLNKLIMERLEAAGVK